jgi:hypothetical protein
MANSHPLTQDEGNQLCRALVEIADVLEAAGAELGPAVAYCRDRARLADAGRWGSDGIDAALDERSKESAARRLEVAPNPFDAHPEQQAAKREMYARLRREGVM